MLEPHARTSHAALLGPPPSGTPGGSRHPHLFSGWVVACVVLVLVTQLTSPAEQATIWSIEMAVYVPTVVDPEPTPPSTRTSFVATPNPFPSPAVAALETFVTAIDRGDVEAAVELLVDELPNVVGVGTAQYPHVPTDAGLWVDGVLDRVNAVGFVEYLFTVPVSVSVSECTPRAGGFQVTLVTCAYTTSGGVLAPLGQGPETGRLYGVIADEQVAGLIRVGDAQADLWARFADWVTSNHPSRSPSTVTRAESGWVFDPRYTAAGALEHRALAIAMAAELSRASALPREEVSAVVGAMSRPG